MEISRHIFFDGSDAPELLAYLRASGIPHISSPIVVFDILESSPHWPEIQRMVEAPNITALTDTIFSKQELSSASWLQMRSKWNNGYPQPEDAFRYQDITYAPNSYCPVCNSGLRQVAPFRLRATPKWGKRHFMSLNWVPDELFVDDIARNILDDKQYTGIHFSEVHNKSGTVTLPGVFQLCVEAITQPGFIEGRDDLHEVTVCSVCGRKRMHPNGRGMHAFCTEAFENMPDVCKSMEYFGWGHGSDRLIFVRQSVYRTIMDNHIGNSLVFEPILLV